MKKIIYFLVAGALVASCAKKKEVLEETATPETATEQEVVYEDVDATEKKEELLHFEAFTVKDDSGMSGFSVDKKGEVLINGQVLGTIDELGSIKNLDGKIVVAVNEDGTFYFVGKDTIQKLFTVAEDGSTATHDGKVIKWDDKGELLFDGQPSGLKMIPAQPSAYKVASILVYIYFNGESLREE